MFLALDWSLVFGIRGVALSESYLKCGPDPANTLLDRTLQLNENKVCY